MQIKIGFAGAPASGKTTLAARLFADCLEAGAASSVLVQEYAREHLSSGQTISNMMEQSIVSSVQIDREDAAVFNKFSLVFCDSAVWLGKIYLDFRLLTEGKTQLEKDWYRFDEAKEDYINSVTSNRPEYDLIVHVPLFSDETMINPMRIHDFNQSKQINSMIFDHITGNKMKNVAMAPRSLSQRSAWSKKLAQELAAVAKGTKSIKNIIK